MKTTYDRYNELIEKYDKNNSSNIVYIIIKDNKDKLITRFDTLFTIGKERKFENVEKATKKFDTLLSNTIVKSKMANDYRFELVINDVVEMVIYKAIPMSYEIYEKMRRLGK